MSLLAAAASCAGDGRVDAQQGLQAAQNAQLSLL
jgi:hypothetical protein